MPSAFTHAAAALALGTAFRRPGPPVGVWIAGAVCAAAPDLDAIGLRFGVPYGHVLGHRGFTHSLVFAALVAGVITVVACRDERWRGRRREVALFLFLATASHGVLDMLTNGGRGVALLAPFSTERLFLPWRPIEVSPLSISRFFSGRGMVVFTSELRWVWLPAGLFAGVCLATRPR